MASISSNCLYYSRNPDLISIFMKNIRELNCGDNYLKIYKFLMSIFSESFNAPLIVKVKLFQKQIIEIINQMCQINEIFFFHVVNSEIMNLISIFSNCNDLSLLTEVKLIS